MLEPVVAVRRSLDVFAMRIENGPGWYSAFEWLENRGARAVLTIDSTNPENTMIEVWVGDQMVPARIGDWLVWIQDRFEVLPHADFATEYEVPW